jgi:hypothetical protein
MLTPRLDHSTSGSSGLANEYLALVNCQLKISEPNESALHMAMSKIVRLRGVNQFFHEPNSNQVFISLNASEACLACIEEVFDEYKISVFQGWLQLLRSEYRRIRDQETSSDGHTIPCSRHDLSTVPL